MSIPTPLTIPVLPHRNGLNVGRPARARDAAGLANALNHLEAWRFRRGTRTLVEVDASACPAAITGLASTPRLPPGPHGLVEAVRVPHYLCTEARNLFVAIGYQADGEATTAPRIDVQLYELGGALLDRGVRFDHAVGNLGTGRQYDDGLFQATGLLPSSFVYPVLWAYTPPVAEDDRRTAATPTDPRLLALADATPRTRVEVRVTSTFARVVAVCVWEWPEAML